MIESAALGRCLPATTLLLATRSICDAAPAAPCCYAVSWLHCASRRQDSAFAMGRDRSQRRLFGARYRACRRGRAPLSANCQTASTLTMRDVEAYFASLCAVAHAPMGRAALPRQTAAEGRGGAASTRRRYRRAQYFIEPQICFSA